MSKLKKLLSLLLVVTITAGISIAGTMAYLTSEDSDVNVMTLGNVKIQQNEYQRVIGADGLETSELEAFEQGKVMMPYTDRNPKPEDTIFTVGEYSVTQDRAKGNYVDKIVSVTNTGKSDAYVRTILAIPSGGSAWEPEDTAAAQTWLHWNTKKAMNDHWHSQWTDSATYDGFFAEIDGQGYYIYEFTHNTAIEPGYETFPTLVGCYMDKRVNHDDAGYYMDYNTNGKYDDGDKRIEDIEVGGTVELLVISQATQEAGFADAQTALDTSFGDVTPENVAKWFAGLTVKHDVKGNDKTAVLAAIESANPGETVVLTEDTTIEGYAATNKLVIDKEITLDLNGKTLTTECGWGGIDLKGGASIINGTINHIGNTAAIKAFQAGKIENVVINVTETNGKTKGGIVLQQGDDCYVGSIKNVTITGATNGIECYRSTNENAIGIMENVKIDATANGIYLNGAGRIGEISNCEIKGGNIGVNAYLANLWHISLNIKDSTVTGGTTGIDIWDEAATNTGSTVAFNYDDVTVFAGDRENIKITLQEVITCTVNGKAQTTPCDVRITE